MFNVLNTRNFSLSSILSFCSLAALSLSASAQTDLAAGVPANDLSGARNSSQIFKIDIPSGATNFVVKTSGGVGDADLYVRFNREPTRRRFDCRPFIGGNEETCSFGSPQAGTYFINIIGYSAFSGMSLEASYDNGGNPTPTPIPTPTTTPVPTTTPTPGPGGCQPTAEEAELVAAHNAARAQGRNCGSTFYPAAPPVQWSCKLGEAARNHNQDMVTNNFFSHTGSDGLSPFDRITNLGYNFSNAGENIAAGQTSVDSVMSTWLNSPGHYGNIMGASFTEIGASGLDGAGAQYSKYWTTVMARPQ